MLIFSAFFFEIRIVKCEKKRSNYNLLIEHFFFKGDSAMQFNYEHIQQKG